MSGRLAALALAEQQKPHGRLVYPALDLTIDGSSWRYAKSGLMSLSRGQYGGRAQRWGPVSYATSDEKIGRIVWPEMSVFIDDTPQPPATLGSYRAGTFEAAIAGARAHVVRGSAAVVRLLSPNYSLADSPVIFNGVLDAYPLAEGAAHRYELKLKPNAGWLKSFVPKLGLKPSDFPRADPKAFGLFAPIVYGIHDSRGYGRTGAVPLPEVDTLNRYFLVSLGRIKSVDRVFVNDVEVTSFASSYPIINGRQWQLVTTIVPTPAVGAVVTADLQGYEPVGDGSGAVMTNPITQLRHLIVNHASGDYQRGSWASVGSTTIDTTFFTEAEAYATAKGMMASRRYGAAQIRMEDALAEDCVSFGMRCFFTKSGNVAIRASDHRLPSTARTWFKWDRDGVSNPLHPGNPRFQDETADFASRVAMQFCWSEAQNQYMQNLEVRSTRFALADDVLLPLTLRASHGAV